MGNGFSHVSPPCRHSGVSVRETPRTNTRLSFSDFRPSCNLLINDFSRAAFQLFRVSGPRQQSSLPSIFSCFFAIKRLPKKGGFLTKYYAKKRVQGVDYYLLCLKVFHPNSAVSLLMVCFSAFFLPTGRGHGLERFLQKVSDCSAYGPKP